ncbi:MAG TPA: flagellar hook-length control protein FliK [Candidatus Binatia bacterium]|jgi:flagellar hook-length control protein FliK
MIINGFFPINVNPLQDGMNEEVIGQGAAEGGDFSALLFLVLATPVTQGSQVQGDVGRSLVTVGSDSGSNGDLYDAKGHFIDAPLTLANPGTDNLALRGAMGQLPVTVIAPVETSNAQGVAAPTTVDDVSGVLYSAAAKLLRQDPTTPLPSESSSAAFPIDGHLSQAMATARLEVAAFAVKHEGEGSNGVLSQIPQNSVLSKNLEAEATSLEGNVIEAESITAAVPEEPSASSQAGAADSARDAFKSSANVSQPSIEFRRNAGVAATDAQVTTPNPDAPSANAHIIDQIDPRQERAISLGYSTYAKDIPGQAVSTDARERVSPDNGGLKLGIRLQTETGSEPRGRILSETIHGIGEARPPQPDQGEQGAFFQQGDQTSREPVQAPSEAVRHSDALFHVARLADNGPAAVRVAEAAQWGPVVEQLAGEIKGRIRIGNTEAIIQLDPPELGKLRIDLHLHGDKLEARIFAETNESRTLLESHLTELRQTLGENRVELVEVSVESGSWGSAHGDGDQGSRQEASGGRRSANDFDGTARSASEEQVAVWRQRGAGEPGRVSMWA